VGFPPNDDLANHHSGGGVDDRHPVGGRADDVHPLSAARLGRHGLGGEQAGQAGEQEHQPATLHRQFSFSRSRSPAGYATAGSLAAGTGRPTLAMAPTRRSSRPHSELTKMVLTLAAMATMAHTG
jgi:hypothetical protein